MINYQKLLRYFFSIGAVFVVLSYSFRLIDFRPLVVLARIGLFPSVLSSILIGSAIAYVVEKMGKGKVILLLCLLPFYYFYSFVFSAFLNLTMGGSMAGLNYSSGFNQTFWPELLAMTLLIFLFVVTVNKLKLFIPLNVALFILCLLSFVLVFGRHWFSI